MGLMDILNGMQNGPRGPASPNQSSGEQGGMSPITMAMLALLAYKAYGKLTEGQSRSAPAGGPANPLPNPTQANQAPGGLGDLLGGLLGGGAAQNNPRANPQAGGMPGGLGDLLGGLLGGGAPANPRANPGGLANSGAGTGGLGGALGGLLAGGAAGGLLSSGLQDLLESMQQKGQGDVAGSWVGTGPNKQISPNDLNDALGDDTVTSLAEQAGLSKVALLDGLSQQLPQFVDQLTPEGRVPTEHEMSQFI